MTDRRKIEPKLVTLLREGYSRQQFGHDLLAGLIVGIVALPLAIAFGIASGVKPEQGLVTAVVAGFLISCLSGSRVQIGGPTGAFIVLVYAIVQQHGYEGLAVATLMAGVLLILLGAMGLGTVIQYIPYPVTVGFTAGIAVIIAVAQVRDVLGLAMDSVPAEFVPKLEAYARHLHGINLWALAIAALTVAVMLAWPRVSRRVPGSLVALVLTTALVRLLDLPAETIADRFGAVPSALPTPRLPALSWDLMRGTFSPAISIALLAGIESLLSAVVADGMTGRRHRPNTELVAQGFANIASPLFGGIPATGAIARTATNVKNGGRTPVAGLVHAVTLLLIMVLFGRWAAMIPMATLGGILLVVAYHMAEWHLFAKLFRAPRSDVLVLVLTFLLTVFVDLSVAIQVGVVLAALLFMRRMAEVTKVGYVTELLGAEEDPDDPNAVGRLAVPPGVEVFEVNGPFFFGATDKFKDALGQIERRPRVLILRMRRVLSLDASALTALESVHDHTRREGTTLILAGVHAQPLVALHDAGLIARFGEENLTESLRQAVARARAVLGLPSDPTPPSGVPEVRREAISGGPAAAGP